MKNAVSIIIPALNEERTIFGTVIECLKAKKVLEVIVVDDKSSDRTVELSMKAGAKVITSDVRGKGASMKDGLDVAKGDVLVYVDADIKNFNFNMINTITVPILEGSCDFVKSSYGRKSGRVTELMAKPLLAGLFPSLISFKQPLSGIIAGKKLFFERVHFENDYGVDVGILIDMVNSGARIKEVDIGYIDHKMKPWRKLIGMSAEVANSIIKRAKLTNRTVQQGIVAEACILSDLMAKGTEVAFPIHKVAFLDMDGTLIRKRFIFEFSRVRGFLGEVERISSLAIESYAKTKTIASLLRGISKSELIGFGRLLDLSPGAADLVRRLKKAGFFTVILTDSYESVALAVADRLGADMVIANRLAHENGVCSGDIEVNPLFFPSHPSCASHASCKLNAAIRFCSAHDVPFENTFAIGDSENDVCLLRFANQSYAYRPASASVAEASKATVDDLKEVKL